MFLIYFRCTGVGPYVLFNDMTLFIMVFQMMAEDVLVSRALAISCSKYSIFLKLVDP
jgi:hypothetical protein